MKYQPLARLITSETRWELEESSCDCSVQKARDGLTILEEVSVSSIAENNKEKALCLKIKWNIFDLCQQQNSSGEENMQNSVCLSSNLTCLATVLKFFSFYNKLQLVLPMIYNMKQQFSTGRDSSPRYRPTDWQDGYQSQTWSRTRIWIFWRFLLFSLSLHTCSVWVIVVKSTVRAIVCSNYIAHRGGMNAVL